MSTKTRRKPCLPTCTCMCHEVPGGGGTHPNVDCREVKALEERTPRTWWVIYDTKLLRYFTGRTVKWHKKIKEARRYAFILQARCVDVGIYKRPWLTGRLRAVPVNRAGEEISMEKDRVVRTRTGLAGLALQALFSKAITAEYRADSMKPGLVLSSITEDPPNFYASVCRYYNGGQKTVVCHANGITLTKAMRECLKVWLAIVDPPPKEDLLAELRASLK